MRNGKDRIGLALLICLLSGAAHAAPDSVALHTHARNPLLPGYFADPSIVRYHGEWFLYATIDPWGGDTLGLWRSRNFHDWTFETPNWPTKATAKSATSGNSGVWAPSVVRARDGRFWMYASVGNEIWVGVAPHPAGPWRNALGDRPLIPRNFRPGLHMIDAEAFIDDDGQAYLYWGSGLNWTNGHCFVVKLRPDMMSFDGEPRDVTPAHYFEAPFMLKRDGRYFLTYSWGNTTTDTYQVRYAVGDTPLGPFREPEDRPILATDAARDIVSPGHHAIFRAGGRDFILYHRQALPFPRTGDDVLRQVAVDRLRFESGRILPVTPTHDGVDISGAARHRRIGAPLVLTASSSLDPGHDAARAGDDNYATSWQPAPADAQPWLQADLGAVRTVRSSEVRPAFVTATQRFSIETSRDGIASHRAGATRVAGGSPIRLTGIGRARFIRLRIATPAAIMEWIVR